MDVVVTGPDAPELAAALRWPPPSGGAFGFRGLPASAAALRELQARRVIAKLGLEVALDGPGTARSG